MNRARRDVTDLLKTIAGFGKKPKELLNCVRISRNLENFPFASQATSEQKAQISREVIKVCRNLPNFDEKNGLVLHWQECNAAERCVLKFAYFLEDPNDDTVFIFPKNRRLCVIVNDCDHIRLEYVGADVCLKTCWEHVDTVDTLLQENLKFSFDPEKGFDTCSAETRGTGLKIFSLVHLPVICYREALSQVISALEAMSLEIEPYARIEDDKFLGHLFLVSNTTGLGCTEEDLVEHVEKTVDALITQENRLRKELLKEDKIFVKDSAGRALGVLRNCYEITCEELINLISIIVMAMEMKIFSNKERHTLLRDWYCACSMRLRQSLEEDGGKDARQFRAEMMRRFFERNKDLYSIETKGGAYVS